MINNFVIFAVFFAVTAFQTPNLPAQANDGAATDAFKTDVSYYSETALEKADEYQRTQCKLDIYYPENQKEYPTVIWLHGGGLSSGERYVPAGFKNQGIAVVAVSYRLSPKAALTNFFDDTAAATAWVLKNIASYGGDPKKVFISGASAGGYLAAMVGMDSRWLKPYGISNLDLAGIIPISGQVTTHFLVKKLRGDSGNQYRPIIDEYAPLYYTSKNLPPICLITGDRRIEFKSRVEENELFAISLKNVGHKQTEFYEMGGLDHNGVGEGGILLARNFIKKLSIKTAAPKTTTYFRANEWKDQLDDYYRKDETAFPAPGAILFVGSSTLRMWNNIESYFPKHRIINRGFGGAWISDVLFHMQRLVIDYKPAQIVLYAGINDINNGIPPQKVIDDIKCFVRVAEINLPGVPIIILSFNHAPATLNKFNEQLSANKLLTEYCKDRPGITLLDSATLMFGENGKLREELYLKDRVHVTPEAYRLLANLIEPHLIDNNHKN